MKVEKETQHSKRRADQVVHWEIRQRRVLPAAASAAISHSLGAHIEAFQVTSEDDSDTDADSSNHEPVVNSTPPAIATSTITAVAASDDVCDVCLMEPRERVALVPCGIVGISILLRLYEWMSNL